MTSKMHVTFQQKWSVSFCYRTYLVSNFSKKLSYIKWFWIMTYEQPEQLIVKLSWNLPDCLRIDLLLLLQKNRQYFYV